MLFYKLIPYDWRNVDTIVILLDKTRLTPELDW